jgi:hypothetical protein
MKTTIKLNVFGLIFWAIAISLATNGYISWWIIVLFALWSIKFWVKL